MRDSIARILAAWVRAVSTGAPMPLSMAMAYRRYTSRSCWSAGWVYSSCVSNCDPGANTSTWVLLSLASGMATALISGEPP